MKNIERFLEFDGKKISVLLNNGEWWIAIKPICEALGVNYKKQHESIIEDEILSQLSTLQGMVGADGRLRNMTCLPEEFIYGWLFSIRSDAPGLKEYKMQCYRVLYKHFHGNMTARMNLLTEKLANIEQMDTIKSSKIVEDLRRLENRNKKLDKDLKILDVDLINGQYVFDLKTK